MSFFRKNYFCWSNSAILFSNVWYSSIISSTYSLEKPVWRSYWCRGFSYSYFLVSRMAFLNLDNSSFVVFLRPYCYFCSFLNFVLISIRFGSWGFFSNGFSASLIIKGGLSVWIRLLLNDFLTNLASLSLSVKTIVFLGLVWIYENSSDGKLSIIYVFSLLSPSEALLPFLLLMKVCWKPGRCKLTSVEFLAMGLRSPTSLLRLRGM